MIRILVFDLDDTLFREHEYVCSGFRAVGAEVERRFGASGFTKRALERFEKGERGQIFNDVLAELGVPADADSVKSLVAFYRDHEPQIELYADAKWALAHFGKKRYRFGLISDGYANAQRQKWRALAINTPFDCVVFSDELGGREAWKPSEKPYREVMETMRAPAESLVYIGDNPSKDFISARRLGWRTIHVMRPEGEYGQQSWDESHAADITIATLFDLQEAIEYFPLT